MRKYQIGVVVLVLLVAVSLSLVQADTSKAMNTQAMTAKSGQGHTMVTPNDVKWGPGPPSLPAGAQIAILEGDPSKSGKTYTLRLKTPDGYKIPPHWHPTDENITVLQGVLVMGIGDKFDQAAAHELTVGSYMKFPRKTPHYGWAKGETITQVHGIGPFEVTYVNPDDDPRKLTKK